MRRAAHNVVKLPIEFSFILSRVFSLKVATFCSNPFEHVVGGMHEGERMNSNMQC